MTVVVRVLAALLLALAALPAAAKVLELEVTSVESPAFGGKAFGTVGTYDRIRGRLLIGIDPAHRLNKDIADIARAPRNGSGLVEASTEIEILRPTDPAKGNGTLLFEAVNRGRRLGLILFNDGPGKDDLSDAAAIGNGFLMEQGFTVAWAGWQFDAPTSGGQLALKLPTIPGIAGEAVEEWVFNDTTNPRNATLTYPAASLDPRRSTLTVRAFPGDQRQMPKDLSFTFAAPNRISIQRPAGFDAGAIYELVYDATGAVPVGISLAVPRDVAAYLRHETADSRGRPNPVAGTIRKAIHFGLSQSGRYVRDALHYGFNEDEQGRIAFEGLMPHIAGGKRGWFDGRFAQPGRSVGQHGSHFYPGDQFPFTYAVTTDPVTGASDGIMKRCLAAGNCPKIMHTDTELEVYNSRASLVVSDGKGAHVALPDNVRAYLIANTPHFSRTGATVGTAAACVHPTNPLHAGAPMRALLVAMNQWLDGTAPPPSRTFSRTDGTLVPPDEAAGVPAIPGFTYTGTVNRLRVLDHSSYPPKEGAEYAVMVGRTDGDGHTVAGIRMPVVEAPVASYFGFNYRKAGYAEGALCDLIGTMLALPKTRAEREAAKDPRPSLEERYGGREGYLKAVEAAARKLVADRLMLERDVAPTIAAAGKLM